MNKHIFHGLIVGGLFAVMITWVAAFDAIAEGGLALLASAVFGLAAGLCIGGLIAANFAMLAVEEKEEREAVAHRLTHAHANSQQHQDPRSESKKADSEHHTTAPDCRRGAARCAPYTNDHYHLSIAA